MQTAEGTDQQHYKLKLFTLNLSSANILAIFALYHHHHYVLMTPSFAIIATMNFIFSLDKVVTKLKLNLGYELYR